MKKVVFRLFVAGFAFLALSCEKDVEPTNTLALSELEKNNYIKAFIDNQEVNLTGKLPLADILFNAYIQSENTLRMQRLDTANPNITFDLVVENVNYPALNLPTTVTYTADSLNQPSLAMFYYDSLGNVFSNNILDPNSFSLTISSAEQDLVIGSFEGTLYNQSQDSIAVSNGLYRIKIKKYD